jgi:hypothetical protein
MIIILCMGDFHRSIQVALTQFLYAHMTPALLHARRAARYLLTQSPRGREEVSLFPVALEKKL